MKTQPKFDEAKAREARRLFELSRHPAKGVPDDGPLTAAEIAQVRVLLEKFRGAL